MVSTSTSCSILWATAFLCHFLLPSNLTTNPSSVLLQAVILARGTDRIFRDQIGAMACASNGSRYNLDGGQLVLGSELSERTVDQIKRARAKARGRELLGVLSQVLHGLMSFSLVLLDIEGHEVNNPVMTLVMQLRWLAATGDMIPTQGCGCCWLPSCFAPLLDCLVDQAIRPYSSW